IPAVGFGAGDVTIHDFLETHGLLPTYKPTAELYISTLDETFLEPARQLAQTLREGGLNVAIDLSGKKVGDQLKIAHKQNIPFVLVIGENEVKSGEYPLKNMSSGEENKVKIEEIVGVIRSHS